MGRVIAETRVPMALTFRVQRRSPRLRSPSPTLLWPDCQLSGKVYAREDQKSPFPQRPRLYLGSGSVLEMIHITYCVSFFRNAKGSSQCLLQNIYS
jgi:hypothetical protein